MSCWPDFNYILPRIDIGLNLFLIEQKDRRMDINEFTQAIKLLDQIDSNKMKYLVNDIKASLEQYEADYNKLGMAMYRLCEQIMKIKDVKSQYVEFYQDLICTVIRFSIRHQFRVGFDAMRFVFNLNADYYKTANLDQSLAYPIGKDHPLKQYNPEVGQQCDTVRPYITSTSFCGWTRCTILQIENNKYTIQYANTNNPNNVREKPWLAPLGTRTEDYEWRMGLDIGSQVQVLLNRVWYKATVVQIGMENGSKRARITYRRFDQNGDRQDSQGNKYFGLGIGEDEWLDVLSSRIQKCGKMVDLKLCYYTFNSDQIVLDDSYDIIFQKQFKQTPFYAIMRVISCKSLSLIKFIDTFVSQKGLVKISQIMNSNEFNDDIVYHILASISVMIPFYPRMFIKNNPFFQNFYTKIFSYLISTAKFLNNFKLQIGFYCYDTLGRRLFSLSEVHAHQNQLRKGLAKQFLKMNMEKQMLALRYLNELLNPKKQYSEAERMALNKFLKDENIFGQIYNPNTHEQIISRTVGLLQYLIQKDIITIKQFESLWKIVPATDTRGRSMIEKLLTEISKNIPIIYVEFLIQKILVLKETELTVENLNLLRELKNRQINNQSQMKILGFLWDVLTVKSAGVKESIQEEVQKVFKAFISTIEDPKIKVKLLQSMCQKLQDCKKIKNQIELLKDFIKSYPQTIGKGKNADLDYQNIPLTIYDAVSFLKNKGVYAGLLDILSRTKDQNVKKDILHFYGFLFQHDFEDINSIIKLVYQKLGPSIKFLQWVHSLLDRSLNFVVQLLENTTQFLPFEKIDQKGFDSIQGMIVDVNNTKKNILKLKTGQTRSKIVTETLKKNDKNKNKKEEKAEEKLSHFPVHQAKYSFSVLVSPFKLIGMRFLQHLLLVVKESKIYDAIIRLIIQFISNIDESIQHKTEDFRREFLNQITKQIKTIVQQNKIDDKVKAKLTVYVNLLFQIFGETEKNGIGDLKPHFESIQGDILSINVINEIDKERNKKNPNFLSKFAIVCNENFTIWKFKQRISQITTIKPELFDLIKYSDPMPETINGKSLNQMAFYDNQDVKIAKKVAKATGKCNLINQDGTDVSSKLLKVIKILFNQYKNMEVDGLRMVQMETLAGQRWKGSLFRQTQWLLRIFKEHDKQKKGYLTLDDFKDFFYVNAIKNQNAIWKIINLAGFKNNLTSSSIGVDIQITPVNTSALPRRILSSPEVFDLIFTILENQTFKEVHITFYKLLDRLQTDERVRKSIETDIYQIINNEKSPYKLSYSLEVFNSELSKKSDFFYTFWKSNGLDLIQKKLREFFQNEKSPSSFSQITKQVIIPNLLKVQQMYTRQILSNLKMVRFISVNKINHLDPKDFIKKVNDLKINENAPELTETGRKLREFDQYQTILKKLFTLSNQILNILMKNYGLEKSEYLQKITIQVVRLVGCILSSNQKYHDFQPMQYLHGIKNGSLNYRRSSIILIYIYLFYSESPKPEQVEKIIQQMLKQLPKQNKFEFEEYFLIINELICRYMHMNYDKNQKDQYFIELGNGLLDTIFNELEGENRNNSCSDRTIVGILEIIDTLVRKQSIAKALSKRKGQITQKCLFAYDIQQKLKQVDITQDMLSRQKQENHFKHYVMCKNQVSRSLAYAIINRLHEVSHQDEEQYLNKYILPIIKSIDQDVRISSNRCLAVGLKNFGSTCYMNSMLQVLNTVEPFRNSLMKVDSEAGVIKELKKLFASLYFSQRVDYAPRDLLSAFVPPINPGIQQDTTQFLNFLFDQLEAALSSTQYKKLLDELFKGANTSQMICHSCGYKKENREEFFSFGVEIQGKTDLFSALEGSYQGQIISDYLCDSCHNRGETTKRNILTQIPNIMFIHLRRIVFNYDMFVNMKIHSRLEFPAELNIEPYTKEGVELRQSFGLEYMKNLSHNEEQQKKFDKLAEHGKQKDFYKMQLKGIIVHSGSADVGHYYSILQYEKAWRKFDDSRISLFVNSDFQNFCYGGSFVADQWGSGTSANAYVLVYEKVIKNSIQVIPGNGNSIQVLKYEDFKIYNSPMYYRQLWLDNHNFMVESQLLDPKTCRFFMNFMIKLLADSTKCPNKIEIISQLVYRIVFHSGFIGDLLKILLTYASEANSAIFYNYVLKDKNRTFKLLFHHERAVREFMASYIQIVLMQSYHKGDQKIKSDVLNYISELLSLLPGDVAKNWMRIDGYFKFIFLVLSKSIAFIEMWKFFVSKNLISTFIDFLLEKQSPVKINPKNHSVGTKTNPLEFFFAISTIYFLLRHSYGFTGKNHESNEIPQEFLFHLNDNDVTCLSHIEFYRKMLKERQNIFELSGIIHRLCIKNIGFSKAICEVLLETINSITDSKDEMYDLSNVCLDILKIKDQLWYNRAQVLLGVGMPSVLNNNLLTTLQQETFVYNSTICDIFPTESLISYSYLFRLQNTLACFQLVRAILQGCSISDEAMKYLARQPSPSYLYPSLVSWMENFIHTFIGFVSVQKRHRQRLEEQISNTLKYVQDMKKFITDHPQIDYYRSLITGQIGKRTQILSFENQGIEIKLYEYEVNCCESKPTGSSNLAMDETLALIKKTKNISSNSNVWKFVKKSGKAITLKLAPIQQDEDKEIVSLFDESPYPSLDLPTKQQPRQDIDEDDLFDQKEKPKSMVTPSEPQQDKSRHSQVQINVQGAFVNNYFRQIEVVNKSKDKKVVQLIFNFSEPCNFVAPKTFSWKIASKSNESLWMAKQDWEQNWGDLHMGCQMQDFVKEKHEKKLITSWWFKTYGFSQQAQEIEVQINKKEEAPQQEPEKKPDDDPVARPEQNQASTEGEGEFKACSVCTFINPGSNTDCQICGMPLS